MRKKNYKILPTYFIKKLKIFSSYYDKKTIQMVHLMINLIFINTSKLKSCKRIRQLINFFNLKILLI